MPAYEGRDTHPLVTWGVREPTNLLAPPGQASRPARGSNTFRWRHLASEEEEFGAVLPLPPPGGVYPSGPALISKETFVGAAVSICDVDMDEDED